MKRLPIELLHEVRQHLLDSVKWLKRSYDICSKIDPNNKLTDEDYDDLEALTARFSRTTDLLTNKCYRAIDNAEFISGGTLIDVINRAAKRGLLDDTNKLKLLKDFRNEIVHEYTNEELLPVFIHATKLSPELINLVEKAVAYIDEKFPADPNNL